LIDEEPWRRERLKSNCDRLRRQLAEAGISTAPSTTHILPIVLGDNERTMRVGERLLERGYFTQGIRHPSVPRGSARLRITPMATHEVSEIDAFAAAIIDTLAEE
jgi:8-amino-7-oxononanoate synthase